MIRKFVYLVVALVILLSVALTGCSSPVTSPSTAETVTITDMYGRTLEVPADINGYLATGSIEMIMGLMVAPDKMLGLNFSPSGELLHQPALSLPVVGGWFGRQSGNYEEFIAMSPDVIIEGRPEALEERQTKFGPIPVIGLKTGTNMREYPAAIRFLGDLLGKTAETDRILEFYDEALAFADSVRESIPEAERVRVYYAEGNNGLSTDPSGSIHTEIIDLCGGINVADVSLAGGFGMIEVNEEQVLAWDPDIIIIGRASQAQLYTTITTSGGFWSQLRPVQEGRVYVRPENPFSWFDGPVGPNQVIGLYWMVYRLYPERISLDELGEKTREFYEIFYHYQLSDAELAGLLE